jgi:hypothetical protein
MGLDRATTARIRLTKPFLCWTGRSPAELAVSGLCVSSLKALETVQVAE